MSARKRTKRHCETCGKALTQSARGASAVSMEADGEINWCLNWCLNCWDNDPRALAQYQFVDATWKSRRG